MTSPKAAEVSISRRVIGVRWNMVDASLPAPCFTSGLARQPALEGFGLDEDSFDFRFLPADLLLQTINRRFEFSDSQVHINS